MTRQLTFPRIGGPSTVFDAVTVTYRNGAYAATARRDGIRATVRTSYAGDHPATASEMATGAAWRARLAMTEKWRQEGHRRDVGDLADQTAAEWSDPDRYAVVVSTEVPGIGYLVTFIPRELAGMPQTTPSVGRRVQFPAIYPGETFTATDPANGIYTLTRTGQRVQVNHDATAWEYAR